jgi:hypothetical protein
LAAGLCILSMAAPVAAKPATGQTLQQNDRLEVSNADSPRSEAQASLYDYAACVAKARPKQVDMFLATFPFSTRAGATARKMVSDQCGIEEDLTFLPESLRGPLYQELYRLDFGGTAPANVAAAPKLNYAAHANSSDPINVNLRVFADCTVRRDPAAARSLVLSNVGSADESAALQRIAAPMSNCIVQGDTVKLTRPLVRGLVAEVLYRLTAASAGRPAPADRS